MGWWILWPISRSLSTFFPPYFSPYVFFQSYFLHFCTHFQTLPHFLLRLAALCFQLDAVSIVALGALIVPQLALPRVLSLFEDWLLHLDVGLTLTQFPLSGSVVVVGGVPVLSEFLSSLGVLLWSLLPLSLLL